MKLLPHIERDLTEFLHTGRPGSITFHSDGKMIRQAEVKLITRYPDEDPEKGR